MHKYIEDEKLQIIAAGPWCEDNTRRLVLRYRPGDSYTPYVIHTQFVYENDGLDSFCWGHYFKDFDDAMYNFVKKLGELFVRWPERAEM